jgi:hypothetical protein
MYRKNFNMQNIFSKYSSDLLTYIEHQIDKPINNSIFFYLGTKKKVFKAIYKNISGVSLCRILKNKCLFEYQLIKFFLFSKKIYFDRNIK